MGRRMKAEKRVAIPKAMGAKKVGAEEEDAKLTLATHLVDQCARAQFQMREAMSEMRKARNFAYTIAQELETELQRFKRYNKRLKEELEEKDAELQRAKMYLKAELEKKEAETYSEDEGLGDSEDRI